MVHYFHVRNGNQKYSLIKLDQIIIEKILTFI